jgi:hypothetical protein
MLKILACGHFFLRDENRGSKIQRLKAVKLERVVVNDVILASEGDS